MKNRFIVIYTVFAAAVFIFSISFFGFNLYKEYITNQKKSEIKFTELVNDIRTLSYAQDENSAGYIQGIKNAVGDAADYSYIQVRRNGETVVLYPTGKSKEETVSKLSKSFNSKLTVNEQAVSVECNLYLIRPDSIFYFARISFLMILIITIITIIMIIYLNLSESSSDVISLEENEDAEENNEIEEEEINDYSSDEIVEEKDFEETEENESSEEIKDEAPTEAQETSEKQETEVKEEDELSEENKAEVTPEEVKAIFATPLTDEETAEAQEPAKLPIDEIQPAPLSQSSDSDEPAGLFDPETGIGWESYLLTRLNNEIDRATASEIDLSLFVFKLTNIEKTSQAYKNVCNYLAIQFQFKDLLFEYKEDCIVAIKISMNVDEALNLADKLYVDISNIVDNKDSRIGISSRSIRMLTGDRLILEAEQAIEHADESSPVIAFRVDSEKYRKLMEQNQA